MASGVKSYLKNYLSITKKDWNGLVVLMVLVILVLMIPYGYRLFCKDKVINFNNFNADATLLSAENADNSANSTDGIKELHPTLFAFNPNHLPDAQWYKLGFSQKQIDVLKHYEEKGGRFYKKSDVQKIYSITPEDYKRIEPYIQLPGGASAIIDVNHADSASLVTLKGIGPAYAMRIIRYRTKLGGFYSKEQLKEVFGIDEEHFLLIKDEIKLNPKAIQKVNINKATFDDLRRYPYLSYKQANAIIQYRSEHGDYENLGDMKDIAILDEAALNKVKPYLVFK